ncbi:MAG: MarR family transcriptional regulator [Robiginitomaculum sp.]
MQNFDLDNFLPYKLSIVSQSISGLIAKTYESKFGLTMNQWRVLVIISNHNPISASEICQRTLIDKMVVSRSVKALRKRKLVLSRPSKQDARKSKLSLTKTGSHIYEDIIPIAKRYEHMLLKRLTGLQRTTLDVIFDELMRGVEECDADQN